MTDALTLYGTNAPTAEAERFQLGALSFTLEQGALRHIRVGDTEIVRGVSFLARDRDWGTLVPKLEPIRRAVAADCITLELRAVYENAGARLSVALTIDATANALRFHATGRAEGDFETNRAGFTILHPAGLAGCPAQITHSDGSATDTAFPGFIDPWQPFEDICRMGFQTEGLDVTATLEGDTFETEDQRQWGDASYKTYNRPLAKPWPYELKDGSQLEQSISLSWRNCDTVPALWTPEKPSGTVHFPETAILVNATDVERVLKTPSDLRDVGPQRLLCSVDDTLGDVAGQCAAFSALQRHFPDVTCDLEAIVSFDGEAPDIALTRLRASMDAAGFAPQSILVCPSVDRQSTPPGSPWPACPPLDDIHLASAQVFPDLHRGGGMVTFFPELNRKRPPVALLGFVSHALCPIVHAADDLSVMETLEAVPHITATARSYIGTADYRIGPSTIAMRHNPYGGRTVPNPNNDRVCMADDDPRHRGAFGAAYTIGLACALASSGITVWTPSELYGPRGSNGYVKAAVTALARLSGEPVHRARLKDGIGTLRAGRHEIFVNLTPELCAGLPAFGWTHQET
ncbi:MAG: hypothetical protein AAGK71_08420 [Pseudomonadota bacterium]